MSEASEIRTVEVEIEYDADEYDILEILDYLHESIHHVDVTFPQLDYRYDHRSNVVDCPECGTSVHESWNECLACGLTAGEAWFT